MAQYNENARGYFDEEEDAKWSDKPQCNGICIIGSEVIACAPVGSVAYPHPDCELHSPIIGDRFTDPAYDVWPSDVDGEDFEIRRLSRDMIGS